MADVDREVDGLEELRVRPFDWVLDREPRDCHKVRMKGGENREQRA
jgi:hypothetical protein